MTKFLLLGTAVLLSAALGFSQEQYPQRKYWRYSSPRIEIPQTGKQLTSPLLSVATRRTASRLLK
jgi:hypothetical protein